METYLNMLTKWGQEYGMNILGALVIFIIGRMVISVLLSIIKKVINKSFKDETLTKFITSLTKMILLTILVIVVLNQLGIQTTSFIAILGAAGLAIGLALQGSLSNFASGVMLIIFKPFKAGDFIEAGGTTGSVESIGVFVTTLKTPDNKIIVVPNGTITSNNIINYSAEDTRRIDFIFGIGYNDDIKKAKNILERIVTEDDRVLKDPAPVVAVSELADSSVNFVVRPWVKTTDYWAVYFDITEKVKLTFDNEGISIPFPQQDVHMHQIPAA